MTGLATVTTRRPNPTPCLFFFFDLDAPVPDSEPGLRGSEYVLAYVQLTPAAPAAHDAKEKRSVIVEQRGRQDRPQRSRSEQIRPDTAWRREQRKTWRALASERERGRENPSQQKAERWHHDLKRGRLRKACVKCSSRSRCPRVACHQMRRVRED